MSKILLNESLLLNKEQDFVFYDFGLRFKIN